jgi:pimeloyl-ACP methyl ester carboxylesterase
VTDITVVGAGGEYMESVVVVEWHKQLGQAVEQDDLIVTVETAKAATEITAPVSGILSEIRAEVGQEIAIGGVLGVISDANDAKASVAGVGELVPTAPEVVAVPLAGRPPVSGGGARVIASPLARRVAAQRGIELANVTPSSESGRIRLRDIEAFERSAVEIAKHVQTPGQRPAVAQGDKSSQLPSNLNVLSRGDAGGRRLVFLHGFGADSYSWLPLVAALGVGFACTLIDLPGHGRSPRPANGMSVCEMADAVAETLAQSSIDEFDLVGHSLGGAVSLALVATGRLSIRSLTLLAPAGLGPEIDGDFISGYSRATRPESLAPWIAKLFADTSLASPSFVSATMQARADAGLREAQIRLADTLFPDGTQSVEFREVIRSSLLPQKIIWGEEDRIIPMRHALRTGGQAALHFLPRVGHMPHVEQPAIVARLVAQNVRSAS